MSANITRTGKLNVLSRLKQSRSARLLALGLATVPSLLATGCAKIQRFDLKRSWQSAPSYHQRVGTQIEYPSVSSCLEPAAASIPRPLTLENPAELQTQDLTLEEAIQMALSSGDVLRSLGGSVVQAPQGSLTKYNPAIVESNPLGGVEAALSAFDAQVASQLFWQKIDQPRNVPVGGIFQNFFVPVVDQKLANFNYQISKTTATGAQFTARHNVAFDSNNSPARRFTGDFIGFFEAEYRQPLMQGAGVEFNRIAGPNSQIGQYNGVLIARINTDISLADFESGIINFISDVERAYWELYFTYHNLEAVTAGRNSSLLTWQRVKELERVGARGGDAAAVAQSRSQYYQFDVQLKEALTGPNGLYAAEQQLRYLLGMPATDGVLFKPSSDPAMAEVIFDWDNSVRDALTQRVEVRRP